MPLGPLETRFDVTDELIMDGAARRRSVTLHCTCEGKTFSFPAAVIVPSRAKGPVPAFLLINNRPVSEADPSRQHRTEFWPLEEIVARGFAAAVFQVGSVQPDEPVEPPGAGVRTVLASPGKSGADAWGTIAAWAWAASRVMDYLVTDPAIDAQRVALVGHSRGGKTALWAGAEDGRFSVVISNDSGCTGAALARRVYGETIHRINQSFPHWFCGNYHAFDNREQELPVDQHELLALIAPRGVYVSSADEDLWADPRGEFLSLVHASPVYALFGGETFKDVAMPPLQTPIGRGRMGYHIRRGGHGLTAYDWRQHMDFAERVWKDRR
jgi:hypothetical protein